MFLDSSRENKKANTILAFAPIFEYKKTNQILATTARSTNSFNNDLDQLRAFLRDGKYISSLPGTQEEVEKIDKLYKKNKLKSAYMIHHEANEEQIKLMNLKKYNYLHFATHNNTLKK